MMSRLSCLMGMGGIWELRNGKIWEWDLSFRWEWEWDGDGNEVIKWKEIRMKNLFSHIATIGSNCTIVSKVILFESYHPNRHTHTHTNDRCSIWTTKYAN